MQYCLRPFFGGGILFSFPFQRIFNNKTGLQLPRYILGIHVRLLQQQKKSFGFFVSSRVHFLYGSILASRVLTVHHSYAAVLVVFLGNFNPSTFTG